MNAPITYPYKGLMLSVAELIELPEARVSRTLLRARLKAGMSVEEALTKPPTPLSKAGRKGSRTWRNFEVSKR